MPGLLSVPENGFFKEIMGWSPDKVRRMLLPEPNSHGQAQVSCDRCGRDCRDTDEYPDSSRTDPYANPLEASVRLHGCYGSTRYDMLLLAADLCEDCATELFAWVDAGPGVGTQRIDMLEADRLFCLEELGEDPSLVVRGGPDQERLRARFAAWFQRRFRLTLHGV